jgi:DNA-binding PucR family transcriptional regulator
VVAPVTAGERRLGYVVLTLCQGPLTDLQLAALEHAATVIALQIVHEQALFESEQRLRGDLLEELLRDQNVSDDYVRRQFEQLGYRVEGAFQILLVQVEGVSDGKPGQQVELGRRRLLMLIQQITSTRNRQSMVVHRNGLFTVLWPLQAKTGQPATAESVTSGVQEVLQSHYPGRRIIIGIGRPCEELRRLRHSFEEALSALQVLQRLNSQHGVLSFADMGIYRILLQSASAQQLLDFSNDTMKPIRDHDARWKTDLEVTLRTYLRAQMNTQKTSEALFVHPNTVMYRMRKLDLVCNIDIKDLKELLRFQLAFMIQEMVKN